MDVILEWMLRREQLLFLGANLMHLEDKIDLLFKWMQVLHEKTGTHDWVREYRPWNSEEEGQYFIVCECDGVWHKATMAEFAKARPKQDGY